MTDNENDLPTEAAAALKYVLLADTGSTADYAFAAKLLARHSQGSLSGTEAVALLTVVDPEYLGLWMMSKAPEPVAQDERLTIVALAVELALADGAISTRERLLLHSLCYRLLITPNDLQSVIYRFDHEEEQDEYDRIIRYFSTRGSTDKGIARPSESTEEEESNLPDLQVLLGIASVLNRILDAHSADSEERHHAASLLTELTDGRIGYATALNILDTATDGDFPPKEFLSELSFQQRLLPLNLAVDVALVDSHITARERQLLEELAVQLMLPKAAIEGLLEARGVDADGVERTSEARKEELRRSLEVLGLSAGADIAAIRAAHRRLLRENHPDLYPESERLAATQRTSAINAAYDLLIGAA